MKLKDLAQQFNSSLISIYEEEESQAIFLVALEKLLHYRWTDYLFKKEEIVIPEIRAKFEAIIKKLQEGIPIQYILGETLFYGLTFKVNPAVLIPRPETEELVVWILEKAQHLQSLSILDIGTGSGCIAITLKKQLPNAQIAALDISNDALTTAKQNAILNAVEVNFILKDILSARFDVQAQPYSIIVSNPPYITQTEKAAMHHNVLENEPHTALFVSNEQPLIFYEAIADYALINLKENGLLFFEINEYLAQETIQLLKDKGFKNIVLKKDMQGKDRMICCEKN